jgi:hypothetical protein
MPEACFQHDAHPGSAHMNDEVPDRDAGIASGMTGDYFGPVRIGAGKEDGSLPSIWAAACMPRM